MSGIARISFQGGGLIIPSKTPYERQLLFEHVAQYAKRHGRVRVELDRQRWTVTAVDDRSQVCEICNQRPDNLSYVSQARSLCHPCARRALR